MTNYSRWVSVILLYCWLRERERERESLTFICLHRKIKRFGNWHLTLLSRKCFFRLASFHFHTPHEHTTNTTTSNNTIHHRLFHIGHTHSSTHSHIYFTNSNCPRLPHLSSCKRSNHLHPSQSSPHEQFVYPHPNMSFSTSVPFPLETFV